MEKCSPATQCFPNRTHEILRLINATASKNKRPAYYDLNKSEMCPFLFCNWDFRVDTLVWDEYRFMSVLILGVGQFSHKLSQHEQIRVLINVTSFQVG